MSEADNTQSQPSAPAQQQPPSNDTADPRAGASKQAPQRSSDLVRAQSAPRQEQPAQQAPQEPKKSSPNPLSGGDPAAQPSPRPRAGYGGSKQTGRQQQETGKQQEQPQSPAQPAKSEGKQPADKGTEKNKDEGGRSGGRRSRRPKGRDKAAAQSSGRPAGAAAQNAQDPQKTNAGGQSAVDDTAADGMDDLTAARAGAAGLGPGPRGGRRKRRREQRETDQSSEGDSKGKGGKGKFLVAMALGLPVLALFVIIMLILALVSGASMAFSSTQAQPGDDSDAKVAQYIPKGWQDVLKDAAKDTEQEPDWAIVPWTVLGGIVQVQTDFARYSPYDNIDRDPGRSVTPIGNGGGTGSGGAGTLGATNGAGPGPVQGISGPGNASSISPSHKGPPAGNLSQQFGWYLWALRQIESGGNYQEGNPKNNGHVTSTATGAYQYLDSTWNNYGGYPHAYLAPPSVQDRREIEDTMKIWHKYGNWQQVIAYHIYPAWAGDPSQHWGECPGGCDANPLSLWDYVDRGINKMWDASKMAPATATTASYEYGSRSGGLMGPGLFADGCQVANPSPGIGGKDDQGTGPYLLTPAAASEMRQHGQDPNNPCDSSAFVAHELAQAALDVHGGQNSPKWVPNGTADDMENARKYWGKVIDQTGIFMDRSFKPGQPCALPSDDPNKPYSVSFKIIYIWRCETTRLRDLYLVTAAKTDDKGNPVYTVEPSRSQADETLVNEALSVSYAASKWKAGKKDCDNSKDDREGIFPMTKAEATEAKVTDRCDIEQNIDGAAKLVLSVEQVEPDKRPHDLGLFEPMEGGWTKLGIALGQDLKLFAVVGPGTDFTATNACTAVMKKFFTAIAPAAGEFASVTNPISADALVRWSNRLQTLEQQQKITDPGWDPACIVGSWAPGFNDTMAQVALGLAGDSAYSSNLNGLSNYYAAEEDALKGIDPVPGTDSLVVPRLAPRPLNDIQAPIADDATEVWSLLGSTDGVEIPLDQLAVEYAWFFGGVIAPFNSAGQLIGSLAQGGGATDGGGGGTVQVTVGPDGCPTNAPPNTLRAGADKIGVHKLCVDSVAKARTPQAAMAIKYALTHLGVPYCECVPQRNEPGYYDCSSFVSRAYRDSGAIPNLYKGNAPTTDVLRAVPWTHQISLAQAQPGDLVEPHSGHVTMQLADGYKVHTNQTGDVSHVERAYTSAYWVGWVDPTKV